MTPPFPLSPRSEGGEVYSTWRRRCHQQRQKFAGDGWTLTRFGLASLGTVISGRATKRRCLSSIAIFCPLARPARVSCVRAAQRERPQTRRNQCAGGGVCAPKFRTVSEVCAVNIEAPTHHRHRAQRHPRARPRAAGPGGGRGRRARPSRVGVSAARARGFPHQKEKQNQKAKKTQEPITRRQITNTNQDRCISNSQ